MPLMLNPVPLTFTSETTTSMDPELLRAAVIVFDDPTVTLPKESVAGENPIALLDPPEPERSIVVFAVEPLD